MEIQKIIKDGSNILIYIGDDKAYKYDVLAKALYMPTGRRMKNMSKALLESSNMSAGEYLVLEGIRMVMNGSSVEMLRRIEPYISNLDLVRTYYFSEIPDELPQGYIKWLRENNSKVSRDSLRTFKSEMAMKQWCKEDREFYNFLFEHFEDKEHFDIETFRNLQTAEKRQMFRQIFKTTAKGFDWNFGYEYHHFCEKVRWDFPNNWEEITDPNRNFEHNIMLVEDDENKERNEAACEWQKNFKCLENIENDKLVVVVPTDMFTFHDESKQQNNCVSYYYHDSMAEHRNIIYFIRKKDRPKKSYITNRFHVSDSQTTESRAVNNRSYEDEDVTALISIIDEKINEILNADE